MSITFRPYHRAHYRIIWLSVRLTSKLYSVDSLAHQQRPNYSLNTDQWLGISRDLIKTGSVQSSKIKNKTGFLIGQWISLITNLKTFWRPIIPATRFQHPNKFWASNSFSDSSTNRYKSRTPCRLIVCYNHDEFTAHYLMERSHKPQPLHRLVNYCIGWCARECPL